MSIHRHFWITKYSSQYTQKRPFRIYVGTSWRRISSLLSLVLLFILFSMWICSIIYGFCVLVFMSSSMFPILYLFLTRWIALFDFYTSGNLRFVIPTYIFLYDGRFCPDRICFYFQCCWEKVLLQYRNRHVL